MTDEQAERIINGLRKIDNSVGYVGIALFLILIVLATK